MDFLLADDLTGACDSGIQFINCQTAVVFSPASLEIPPPSDVGMLAINSATRLLDSHVAARETSLLCRKLKSRLGQESLVYKKIDSVLRGNAGVEIDAIRSGLGFACSLISPAYPELGRTVIGGHVLVDGVPLERSSFANDPANPAKESSIAKILAGKDKSVVISESELEHGESGLIKKIEALIASGYSSLIFDATSQKSLDVIAKAGLALVERPLFVGSAGLAKSLAGLICARSEAKKSVLCASRVLFVCGSSHKATATQVALLAQSGVPVLRLPPDFMRRDSFDNLLEDCATALAKGSLVIAAPQERLTESGIWIALSNKLAQISIETLDRAQPDKIAFCLTGGETAFALLEQIGRYMRLEEEIEPGIAAGRLMDGDWKGAPVVTKAGAFGGPEALVNILHKLVD